MKNIWPRPISTGTKDLTRKIDKGDKLITKLRNVEESIMTGYWLLKTEPSEYSWEDLLKDKKAVWEGVKAPAALKNLSRMKEGDLCFIYHTGKERAILGTARVVGMPYPDPLERDPRRLVVDVVPVKSLERPVTLKEIKEKAQFDDWELVRQPRLSVVPVNQKQWDKILEWSEA